MESERLERSSSLFAGFIWCSEAGRKESLKPGQTSLPREAVLGPYGVSLFNLGHWVCLEQIHPLRASRWFDYGRIVTMLQMDLFTWNSPDADDQNPRPRYEYNIHVT
jgi:hypothetical protein